MAARKLPFEKSSVPSDEELSSKFGGDINLGRSVKEVYQNIVIKELLLLASTILVLKKLKIEVWGLHYLLGKAPEKEAQAAVEMMSTLGCDGYLADIEIESEKDFDPAASAKKMEQFFKTLRASKKLRFPVGVVTFDSPSRHRAMPWKEMLEGCDFIAPMTVVGQQYNSGTQLSRSAVEFAEWCAKNKIPHRPYVPVGLADVGKATPTDLMEFIFTAKRLEFRSAMLADWNYLFDRGERQEDNLPLIAVRASQPTTQPAATQ